MSLQSDYLEAFEVHSAEGIRRALVRGASAVAAIDGNRPIECFIAGYLRSPRFAECLRVLLDAGATLDPLVQSILLDDAAALSAVIRVDREVVHRRLTITAAFTLCDGVTPLHLCAEFNCVACAKVLLSAGADIDAPADLDADGFGGQTPIFHAVNSNQNHSRPTMELLVDAGASLDVRVRGLIWGKRQPWETLVLDVTPISYAQCGLYRQFHRNEQDVYRNLQYLYRARYQRDLPRMNVPNAYLARG